MFPSNANGDTAQLEAINETETYKEEPLDEDISGHYLEENINYNNYSIQSESIKPMELLTSENQKMKIPPWQPSSSDKNMIFFEERDEYNPETLESVVEQPFFSKVKPNLSKIDSEICSVLQSVAGLEQKLVEKDESVKEKSSDEATIFRTENCIKERPRTGQGKANKRNCLIIKRAANEDNLFRPISINTNAEPSSCVSFLCQTCNIEHPTIERFNSCTCRENIVTKKWCGPAVKLLLATLLDSRDEFIGLHLLRRGPFFERVAERMRKKLYYFTGVELRKKYSNLLIRYKLISHQNSKTGSIPHRSQTWEFFDLMDALQGRQEDELPVKALMNGSLLPSPVVACNVGAEPSTSTVPPRLEQNPNDCPGTGTVPKKRKLFEAADSSIPKRRKKENAAFAQFMHEQSIFNSDVKAGFAELNANIAKLTNVIETGASELIASASGIQSALIAMTTIISQKK